MSAGIVVILVVGLVITVLVACVICKRRRTKTLDLSIEPNAAVRETSITREDEASPYITPEGQGDGEQHSHTDSETPAIPLDIIPVVDVDSDDNDRYNSQQIRLGKNPSEESLDYRKENRIMYTLSMISHRLICLSDNHLLFLNRLKNVLQCTAQPEDRKKTRLLIAETDNWLLAGKKALIQCSGF